MNRLDSVDRAQLRTDIPAFEPGDTVRVHVRIKESETKERLQAFEGVVIARKGDGIRETFTVRKTSFGVGVERIFPVHGPVIGRVEVVRRGRVRRAKLYYLRNLRGKAARIRELDTRDKSGKAQGACASNKSTYALFGVTRDGRRAGSLFSRPAARLLFCLAYAAGLMAVVFSTRRVV